MVHLLDRYHYAELIHTQNIGERIGLVGVEAVERKAYIEILKRLGTRLPILVGCDVIQCAQILVQARRVIKIDIVGMDKALLVQHIYHTHNLSKVRAVIVVIRAYNHRSVTRRNKFERSLNREPLTACSFTFSKAFARNVQNFSNHSHLYKFDSYPMHLFVFGYYFDCNNLANAVTF